VVGEVADEVDREAPLPEPPAAGGGRVGGEGVDVAARDDRLKGEAVHRLEHQVRRAGGDGAVGGRLGQDRVGDQVLRAGRAIVKVGSGGVEPGHRVGAGGQLGAVVVGQGAVGEQRADAGPVARVHEVAVAAQQVADGVALWHGAAGGR